MNQTEYVHLVNKVAKLEAENIELKQELVACLNKDIHFKSLVENINEGVLIADRNGNHVFANWGAAEISGYNISELLETSIRDLARPEDLEKTKKQLHAVINKEKFDLDYETYLVRKDKKIIPIEVRSSRTQWKGEPADAVFFRDISKRKEAENELRFRSDILSRMLEGVNIVHVDDGSIIYTNPRFEAMFGYGPGELIGQHVSILNASTDRSPEDVALELMKKLMRTGQWKGELKNIKKDGTPFWTYATVCEYDHSQFGNIWLSVQTDITEKRKAEEEIRLQSKMISNLSEGVILVRDSDGIILFNNPKLDIMFGYEQGELIGKKVAILNSPMEDSPEDRADEITTALRNTGRWNGEVHNITKGGVSFWTYANISRIEHSEHGNISVAVLTDITEHKQADEKLRQSEEQYRILAETIKDALFQLDSEGNIVFMNSKGEEMYGYGPGEMTNLHFSSLVPDEWLARGEEHVKTVLSGKIVRDEIFVKHKLGYAFPIEFSIAPIKYEGEVVGFTGVSRDISERKQVEFERKQLAHELDVRVKGLKCLYSMSSLLENKELSRADLWQQLVEIIPNALQHPEIAVASLNLTGEVYATKNFKETGWKQVADIVVRGEKVGKLIVSYLEERPACYYGPFLKEERTLLNVISERIGRAIERIQSEDVANRIFDAQTALLFVLKSDETIVRASKGWQSVTGYAPEELAGRKYFEFVHPDDVQSSRKQSKKIVEGDLLKSFVNRYRTKGGVYRTLLWFSSQNPDNKLHYAVAQDISDLKQAQELESLNEQLTNEIEERMRMEKERLELEKKLRHAHKMEAVGTFAAGIAHDFNNILNIMFGGIEYTKSITPQGSQVAENMKIISDAGARAANLVRQILTFSRQTEQVKQAVSLQALIKELLAVRRKITPESIEIRQKIDQACSAIKADPVQIHQVVTNFVVNAVHAMEDGGILEVGLQEEVVGQGDSRARGITPGEYAHFWVSDTGQGMDSITLEKMFDPYFTTKEKRDGIGLGLAIVHGILEDHDALVSVRSTIGQGTTIDVYFPVMEKEADEPAPIEPKDADPSTRSQKRILLVDDERTNVLIWEIALKDKNFQVVSATNPLDALEMFRHDSEKFDILITDQKMPDMSGIDLIRHIKRIRSDIPVILATGWTDTLDETAIKEHNIEVAYKPHKINDLIAAINKASEEKQ